MTLACISPVLLVESPHLGQPLRVSMAKLMSPLVANESPHLAGWASPAVAVAG